MQSSLVLVPPWTAKIEGSWTRGRHVMRGIEDCRITASFTLSNGQSLGSWVVRAKKNKCHDAPATRKCSVAADKRTIAGQRYTSATARVIHLLSDESSSTMTFGRTMPRARIVGVSRVTDLFRHPHRNTRFSISATHVAARVGLAWLCCAEASMDHHWKVRSHDVMPSTT